ncbi:carbamoyltransferase HypF [Microtetraspora sp. NBRC 16547]|uniref:carbamoyltransferase HypF n=1 Tax=Microtetraspora sp. NBRC 16547 TaxID=3030993 RepID=UPI0024A09EDD|nr:carbamoyltransferase HypF [Microtetraspora sp. NBRC 16547]GLW99991.1 carbamoyltransferase [Microtetraspora sp. NBRC 16547]
MSSGDRTDEPARVRIRVEGIVQGVGFRPYVHSLARRLALSGWVGNDGEGVFIEAEGAAEDIARFQRDLPSQAPPLAVIDRISATVIPVLGERGGRGFDIAGSRGGGRATLISPDVATCADCLSELFDPACRRYRHPFVNCTNCGPRFTIVRDVPYDRRTTTMASFPMCDACAAEYRDPYDRRFHAQPVCCLDCGPALRLLDRHGRAVEGDPLRQAVAVLRSGGVVAVKGLGGYHLAVDATDAAAVRVLRSRKHREDKPFAVMVADLAAARRLCEVGPDAERLLTGAARPIVVLPRRAAVVDPHGIDRTGVGLDGMGAGEVDAVAVEVAPGEDRLGIMLPYTPLHHLLARELARPYVLTSGNVSDEPIAYRDGDAVDRLGGLVDVFLTHDREIHARAEDSVIVLAGGREIPVRRSRGFAPGPLRLPLTARRAVLACGAEVKSTFCLAKGEHAFLSPHIGDLENYETLRSFTDGVAHFRRLFDVAPRLVAYDAHPEYLSTKYALGLCGVDLVAVQHHHAHIASCLADAGEAGPVIGVAFDGTGYGADGTLWGGEVLVADLAGFTRAGHLAAVPMPGGAAAVRQPWRMAAAHLDAAFDGAPPEGLAVWARNASRWDKVVAVARSGVNSPLTSSVGRLFDAVAAVCGIRDSVTYEGQAAVALERLADPAEKGAYPVQVEDAAPLVIRGDDLVRGVVRDLLDGVDPAVVSARFHNGLVAATVAVCVLVRDGAGQGSGRGGAADSRPGPGPGCGVGTVALSGGVFQNGLLLGRLVRALEGRGFRVLTHRRVPPNDGGISFGQAAVAAALDAVSPDTGTTDTASTDTAGRSGISRS